MDRVLTKIRDRLPDEALVLTAAFAPLRWRGVLQPMTMQQVEAMLKDCVLQCGKVCQLRDGDDGEDHEASEVKRHWLERYIRLGDDDALTVSLCTLAEAVSPGMLESDAVCTLFMLRGGDVSKPYNVPLLNEDSDQEENDDDGEEYMRCTPLYAAVEKGKLDLVRLFLSGGAATNGFQAHVAHGDTTATPPYGQTITTPLYEATCWGHCSIVASLLEARADPNDVGTSHYLRCDGGQHHYEETPLWQATSMACESDPTSNRGLTDRKILQILLKHGADPQMTGKTEQFEDEYGRSHSDDSGTSALQYAKKCMNIMPDTYHYQPNPGWASDVYQVLELAVDAVQLPSYVSVTQENRAEYSQPLSLEEPSPVELVAAKDIVELKDGSHQSNAPEVAPATLVDIPPRTAFGIHPETYGLLVFYHWPHETNWATAEPPLFPGFQFLATSNRSRRTMMGIRRNQTCNPDGDPWHIERRTAVALLFLSSLGATEVSQLDVIFQNGIVPCRYINNEPMTAIAWLPGHADILFPANNYDQIYDLEDLIVNRQRHLLEALARCIQSLVCPGKAARHRRCREDLSIAQRAIRVEAQQ